MNEFDTAINEALAEEGVKSKIALAGLAGATMFGATPKMGEPKVTPIEQQAELDDLSPSNYPEESEESEEYDYAKNILARTIWAEGRGERDLDTSLRSIATSIYNRTQEKINKGNIEDGPLAFVKVSLTPEQYSAWNAWTIPNPKKYPDSAKRSGRGWNEANQIAEEMISGTFKPVQQLKGVTHYFNPKTADPSWGRNREFFKIGNHRFLRDRQDFPSPRLGEYKN